MKLPIVFLFFSYLLVAIPAKSEVDEIKNAVWKEVPNTLKPQDRAGHSYPAYVNVGGLIRGKEILAFDLIGTDAGYTRLEVNCRTRKFRATRLGFFESRTRVNYGSLQHGWSKASSEFHQTILSFVCNLEN